MKVCYNKGIQQRGLKKQKTRGRNILERHHCECNSPVESAQRRKEIWMDKPTIKWPKANDAPCYKKFDKEGAGMTASFIANDEKLRENLVNMIYQKENIWTGKDKEWIIVGKGRPIEERNTDHKHSR